MLRFRWNKRVISELGGSPVDSKELANLLLLKSDRAEMLKILQEKANINQISTNDLKIKEINNQLKQLVVLFSDLLK